MTIGICGHFSDSAVAFNGQTVKTRILTSALEEIYGSQNIIRCDTHNWKKHPFRFAANCLSLLCKCNNIILLPAQAAILTLFPMLVILNRVFQRKLHYYVVGGWLLETIEKHPKLLKYLRSITGIYVELHSMEQQLNQLSLENVYYVNKFRKLTIIPENEIPATGKLPLRFCIFSRIMKEKGIEEAIASISETNKKHGRIVCELDIYGQIDPGYMERFSNICCTLPQGIQYLGVVDFSDSCAVLKEYDALLFPTYYEGEGYANTIVDAYASALPVIATNWKYNGEVVRDQIDGVIYDYNKPELLTHIIDGFIKDPESLLKMRHYARQRAFEYEPVTAIANLIVNINNE